MAPEILLKQEYNGHSVDLFALAIILFIMYSGNPPWKHAHPEDPLYSLIFCTKSDLMWKFFNEQKAQGYFSEEFQDLFTNMV
jgi:hypothetical protein